MKATSYNLFMSALFGGRKGSRPPVGNPTSIICHGLMDAAGTGFPQAHRDARAMADLAMTGHEILGFDSVMPVFSVQQEAAALGCRVEWGGRDMMPDVKAHPLADFATADVPANLLEKPSMKTVLDALSLLRHRVGGKVAVVGKVMGPWTLSYHLAGVQNFLLRVGKGLRKPEMKAGVHGMLDRLMEIPIAFARAQFRAGADVVVLADHATGDLVSAGTYEEYLLPRHRIITSEIEGPLILHVCGNCSDRLELFADAGFDAYHFEWRTDAREAVQRIGRKLSLVGNVSNIDALSMGTPEDVYRQARYAIEAGVNIIGPECAIPLSTPVENLKAITLAAGEGY